MSAHTGASLGLLTVAEVAKGMGVMARAHREALEQLVAWIQTYLAAPHPDLGRTGNVCPFIPRALTRDTVYVALVAGDPAIPDVAERMLQTQQWFKEQADEAGSDALYLTVVTIFPELATARIVDVIEGVQALLKSRFMVDGLMIGEFHSLPPERPGLWNADFRPFACPFPALAIRHMVAADFPFVEQQDEHVRLYLERFAEVVPAHLTERVEERIENAEEDVLPSPEQVCSECGQGLDGVHQAHLGRAGTT